MARKRSRISLERVIVELSRENAKLTCGNLSERYFNEVKRDAVAYLTDWQAAQDAGTVADYDLAEVGKIIREQRDVIAGLRADLEDEKAAYREAAEEARRCRAELREVGLL